ncbi:MAG: hypothetical protein R3C03_00985 [Pirellulaceae bacterium]
MAIIVSSTTCDELGTLAGACGLVCEVHLLARQVCISGTLAGSAGLYDKGCPN